MGCRLWGRIELDTTEATQQQQQHEPYFLLFQLLLSCQVVSNSLRPHGLWPASVVCSWDFPGKNTGVGCLLHGIFPTQGLNQHLLCWQMDSLPLSHQVSYTWPISSFSVTHLILVQYLHLGFCGLQKMTVKHDKRYV